jgi:hypothetical protein
MKIEVQALYDRKPIGTVDTAGTDAVETALATAHGLFRDRWL